MYFRQEKVWSIYKTKYFFVLQSLIHLKFFVPEIVVVGG